jgi:HD superfamily phosphohydrolase
MGFHDVKPEILNAVNDIESHVGSFVDKIFEGYSGTNVYVDNKVINDPVWGSIYFEKHEICILDSPLLQRLRNIAQVGTATLTYPSSRHSRFEHSLGVFHVASEIVNNLNKRCVNAVPPREFTMIRLAALLHDIGHCYGSHLSERVYGWMEPFDLVKQHPIFREKKAKAHEIYAYFIINSPAFKTFARGISIPYVNTDEDEFFEFIGQMIVGYPIVEYTEKNKMVSKNYMTDIINGGFDADKLDYMKRDSYFGGLFLEYDIERFLYRININEKTVDNTTYKNLVISLTGVTAIEEIAFCKIMLTSYIYFHQKVLAADAIMNDFSFHAIKNDHIKHPCKFLDITDQALWKCDFLDETINYDTSKKFCDLLNAIRDRRLPKRALVIKTMYIDPTHTAETETEKHYKDFIEKVEKYCTRDPEFNNRYSLIKDHLESTIEGKEADITFFSDTENGQISDQLANIDNIREGIFKIAREIQSAIIDKKKNHKDVLKQIKSFDKYDIYICFRDAPSFSSEEINIIDNDNEPRSLDDIMPLGKWTKTFAANKWAGYIFARDDIVPLVNVAARRYLLEKHGIRLKPDYEYAYLKLEEMKKAKIIEEAY